MAAALSTMRLSMLLCSVARTSRSLDPIRVVKCWPLEGLMLAHKLFTILCASFIILLVPNADGMPTKTQTTLLQLHIYHSYEFD